MLKKILIGGLTTLVVGAVGASAYNTSLKPSLAQAEPQAIAAAVDSAAIVSADSLQSASLNQNQVQVAQQQVRGAANGPGSPAANGQPLAAAAGSSVQAAAGGQGRGNRNGAGGGAGRQSQSGSADGSAVPSPQNGMTELISLEGSVSQVAYPNFYLSTADGQIILASVGNLTYAANLGIDLSEGEVVSVVGYWDTSGTFAIKSLVADGVTYTLRDDLGRPLWSGGANR